MDAPENLFAYTKMLQLQAQADKKSRSSVLKSTVEASKETEGKDTLTESVNMISLGLLSSFTSQT